MRIFPIAPSGRQGLNLPQKQAVFGSAAGRFAVDLGLFLTEGIALQATARSCFNAAYAAPAVALAGWEKAHLILVVMHPAAIAKQRFSHRSLNV
jgi:hypothetical protein